MLRCDIALCVYIGIIPGHDFFFLMGSSYPIESHLT